MAPWTGGSRDFHIMDRPTGGHGNAVNVRDGMHHGSARSRPPLTKAPARRVIDPVMRAQIGAWPISNSGGVLRVKVRRALVSCPSGRLLESAIHRAQTVATCLVESC